MKWGNFRSLWERTSKVNSTLRTQIILGNVIVLSLFLGILGTILRYTAQSVMLASVDRELEARIPPMPQNPSGLEPPGRRRDERRPDFSHERGPKEGFGSPERDRPPFWMRRGGPGFRTGNDQFRPFPFDLEGNCRLPDGGCTLWDKQALISVQKTRGRVFTTIKKNGEFYRVLTHPPFQLPDWMTREDGPDTSNRRWEILQVAYPLTDVYRTLDTLNLVMLGLLPFGLVGSGVAGAWLTDRVLRQVRRMTQVAAAIGAKDLSRRLPAPTTSGQDEFSELAMTFNSLLGRLEIAFQQQEQLIDQQRRFVADASHELKTPLTVIKGNADLGLGFADDPEMARQCLTEIEKATGTMSRLVQDLLLLARSDAGQLGHNRIELYLPDVVSQAIARLPKKNGPVPTLQVEGEPEHLIVCGNEEELTRVFVNLLDNAIRYTPIEGRVTVTVRREHQGVVATVRDTGCGIAPEHLPHLTERFYRVDSARSRSDTDTTSHTTLPRTGRSCDNGGTGLGLSICRSILEAHQGTLHFASQPGHGTTVTVVVKAPGTHRARSCASAR